MQDTLIITGAGYEYDFCWFSTLETGYTLLVQWKDTSLVYNIIFQNFLLDLTILKMLTINVDSATLPGSACLPRQMLTTKLSTLHFSMNGLDNRKLWVVGSSISWTC